MPEELTPVSGRFVPGHPRFGGKKKGTASRVRDLVEQLGPNSDPLRFMLLLIRDRTYTQVIIDESGKKTKRVVAAPLDLILDACKTTAQYLAPKLSSVAHSNSEHDGPIQVETTSLISIMADPALCAAAQEIVLRMIDAEAGVQPKQLAAPQTYPGLREPSSND